MILRQPGDVVAIGLDVGSNTIGCCKMVRRTDAVVKMERDGSFPVRLSEGLSPGGTLSEVAVNRALACVKRVKRDFFEPGARCRVLGTQVLRMTGAPELFTRPAEALLGCPIKIIDGATEAALTARGALFGLPAAPSQPMVLDVGGQSTELSVQARHDHLFSVSMPFGVVSLTERFLGDVPKDDEVDRLVEFVTGELNRYLPEGLDGTLICTGGTPTTLSMLRQGLNKWYPDRIHGDWISAKTLDEWIDRTLSVGAAMRIERYGMRPGRADVFAAGVLVLRIILQVLSKQGFMVSANGLRVGAALSLFDDELVAEWPAKKD